MSGVVFKYLSILWVKLPIEPPTNKPPTNNPEDKFEKFLLTALRIGNAPFLNESSNNFSCNSIGNADI